MSETIERVQQLLKERIAEIDGEVTDLQRAHGAIDGVSTPTRAKTPSSKKTRRRAKRAARGARAEQFLTVVRTKPKATISEIANKMGIARPQASVIAARLEKKGEIERSKNGIRILKKA
jgi:CRP-like cAMP-binding protein